MFTAIVIGILKFFGLAIGVALAAFIVHAIILISIKAKGTYTFHKGYYLLGILVSMAYHFIKWSL
jgi:hypothetical protein